MGTKRKRKSSTCAQGNKRVKLESKSVQVDHPVLRRCYEEVTSLRHYLLNKLPPTSRRRRKLLQGGTFDRESFCASTDSLEAKVLQELLDNVLVGSFAVTSNPDSSQELKRFSQQVFPSTIESSVSRNGTSMAEVVDFSIWTLFHKKYLWASKPPHILCNGMQRAQRNNELDSETIGGWRIPGLVSMFPNESVETLKSSQWQSIINALGDDGDSIMIDLLLDCGIFVPVKNGNGSYYQLSGAPISEMNFISTARQPLVKSDVKIDNTQAPGELLVPRKPSDIRCVRNRMFYAKAALNAKGEVAFGLRHIHVLNRYASSDEPTHAHHILKYMFPRQFKLHNVFTSNTDHRETSQTFHDYTMREKEIANVTIVGGKSTSTPRRLRGVLKTLIRKLQILHKRCSYTKLLEHYCPAPACLNASKVKRKSQPSQSGDIKHHFTELTTPVALVSAFCQAVLANVFPRKLFGEGEEGKANVNLMMRNVDAFLKCRRFESFSLEMAMNGIKIKCISWLRPPNKNANENMSKTDYEKRRELLMELVYFIFDSFLIPLIRTNFYVTESSLHRNRLFYFRHDVWRKLTEPALNHLRTSMFEQMNYDKAVRVLSSRSFGSSQFRLLPKDKGMRPICNLKRRTQVIRQGSRILGKSINSAISPVFHVLNYERLRQPHKIGSSLFSVSDIYTKIRRFNETLKASCNSGRKLYFVKVDVKACFDTIPQITLVQHIEKMLKSKEYTVARYTELKPAEYSLSGQHELKTKISKSFNSLARRAGDMEDFQKTVKENSKSVRPGTVFVDTMAQHSLDDEHFVELLREHVGRNIVKIGKKYYKQTQGIPQGSIMSSLLCNLFYADYERKHLRFLSKDNCLLLRLIDDFLLITTDIGQARQFLHTMHCGNSDYRISISQEKSLVNFAASFNDMPVPQLPAHSPFPYCGMLINTTSLNISKDHAAAKRNKLSDTLTVEYAKAPGQAFRRKMLSALKIQMHTMLLDTSHNTLSTVLSNLHSILRDAANRCSAYIRSLSASSKRPQSSRNIIGTITDVVALALAMAKSKRNRERSPAYKCAVEDKAVRRLGFAAFNRVFERQQAEYVEVVTWLRTELRKPGARPRSKHQAALVERLLRTEAG